MTPRELLLLAPGLAGLGLAVWAVVSFAREGRGDDRRSPTRTPDQAARPESAPGEAPRVAGSPGYLEEFRRNDVRQFVAEIQKISKLSQGILEAPEVEQRSSSRVVLPGETPIVVAAGGRRGFGVLLDVSASGAGLSVSSNASFQVQDVVEIEIASFAVSCRVVHCTKIEAGWRLGLEPRDGQESRQLVRRLLEPIC